MTLTGTQEFRIGEVISQSFQTTIRNIVPFAVVAIIAFVVIALLVVIVGVVFGVSMPMSPGAVESGMPMQGFGAGAIIGMIIVGLLAIAIYMGVAAAIIYGTVQDLRGQRASIGTLLASGVSLAVPLLGTMFVLIVVFIVAAIVAAILNFIPILGAIASIVMFVFLYIVLWVVIPVAVVERPGPIASLQRSIALTKGCRLRILGIVLLLILISIGVMLVSLVFMYLSPLIGGIVQGLLNAFVAVFSTVLLAVGYYRLRAAKEGVDINDIAKVFD